MIPLFSHFVFQLRRIWMRIYHIITASLALVSLLCLLHETMKHCVLYIFSVYICLRMIRIFILLIIHRSLSLSQRVKRGFQKHIEQLQARNQIGPKVLVRFCVYRSLCGHK